MESLPVWVTVIMSLGSLLGGGLGVWLLSVYQARNKHELDSNKQDREIKINENEQAFKIYKELVDALKHDCLKLAEDMTKMEKEHLNCREENAILKTELRNCKREMTWIKKHFNVDVPSEMDEQPAK